MFLAPALNHSATKQKLIDCIASSAYGRMECTTQKISRTDWEVPASIHRTYIDIAFPVMNEHLLTLAKALKYDTPLQLVNYWFQQYETGDHHGWHRHESIFSCVYYVELPEGSSFTTFHLMGDEFSVPVEEGQIISFPSAFEHQSKTNKAGRKTVIAFNAK